MRSGREGRPSRIPARAGRADEGAFDSEPLPMAVRVGLVFLILTSVSVIAYWLGKNERPARVEREARQETPARADQEAARWPDGTVVGNVERRIYHVVGQTRAQLPARANARTFTTVADAEREGYRRSLR